MVGKKKKSDVVFDSESTICSDGDGGGDTGGGRKIQR